MTKDIQYYRKHPVEFAEECFGIKLSHYQKIMIEKSAAQQQAEYICWNRTNQKYTYALFEIIRTLIQNTDFTERHKNE